MAMQKRSMCLGTNNLHQNWDMLTKESSTYNGPGMIMSSEKSEEDEETDEQE